MKKKLHPSPRPVLFVDTSNGKQFLLSSTAPSDRTAKYEVDGKSYPMIQTESSSSSHPVYTGKRLQGGSKEGRVARFNNRFKVQGFTNETAPDASSEAAAE